jgi:uncharacterized membrane protein
MAEETKSSDKNIGMGILCYLGILLIIPLLTDAKNEAFIKFHLKQGIVLLIAGVAIGIISWIPIIGWLVSFVGGIAIFILWLMGIIAVASGEEKELPVIGKYGANFKI